MSKGPVTLDITIAINEDGDWVCSPSDSDDNVVELLMNEAGGECVRTIVVTITDVALPAVTACTVRAPAIDDESTPTVAAENA